MLNCNRAATTCNSIFVMIQYKRNEMTSVLNAVNEIMEDIRWARLKQLAY